MGPYAGGVLAANVGYAVFMMLTGENIAAVCVGSMEAPGFIHGAQPGQPASKKARASKARQSKQRLLAHLLASELHLATLRARVLREEAAPWATS